MTEKEQALRLEAEGVEYVAVRLRDGTLVTAGTLPEGGVAGGVAVAVELEEELPDKSHARDFTAVRWNGEVFALTPKQRPVIALLWEAMEDGYHFVSEAELLNAAESDSARLPWLFRGSPAWDKLIVPGYKHGGRFGTYRLAPSAKGGAA
jgi:hypothetical protein